MADKSARPRGLGRGLSALMSDVTPPSDAGAADTVRRSDMSLPIERIRPNPNQPRRTFDEEAMAELAASIRQKGIIQPLIVRPDPNYPDDFQIVAGERRWRAAQLANIHQAPVIIREYSDTEILEIAIIENIQRADLNPIDEATGYRQLMDNFGHTQEQLAAALGKSRSHIANLLRLLTLPEDVQAYLVEGRLTAGHARALVGRDDAGALARRIIQKGLSVRDTELLTKKSVDGPRKASRTGGKLDKDADTVQIERELGAALGLRVSIDHDPGKESGRLVLSYRDLAQLDDLLRALSGD